VSPVLAGSRRGFCTDECPLLTQSGHQKIRHGPLAAATKRSIGSVNPLRSRLPRSEK
jgi:hypothetical protein